MAAGVRLEIMHLEQAGLALRVRARAVCGGRGFPRTGGERGSTGGRSANRSD